MRKFSPVLGGIAGAVSAFAVIIMLMSLGGWIGSKRDETADTTPTALLQPQADGSAGKTVQVLAIDDKSIETQSVTGNADPVDVAPAIAAPAFDEVRREPDGMTVVAGRAVPGATVRLLRDGVEIATATADGSGKFATLAMIAPDGRGHILTLSQHVDGTDITSIDEIILAPTLGPVEAAQVAPVEPSPDAAPALATDAVPSASSAEATELAETADTETAALDGGATPEAPAEAGALQPAGPATAEISEPQTATTNSPTPSTPTPRTTASAPETAATTTDVAVLKSTAEGVELLNPSAPEVMGTVALDTISYSDEGDVQLAGRAQPETKSVRVYLDNDAVINLPVDDQGRWRGDVPNIDEGIYTLRVDEVGADGTVTSRVETPFKRESAETLATASAAQTGPIKAITVQAGATLWAIARDRYGDGRLYVRVFKANQGEIRDPDLIYPGQVFDLPD